MHIDSFFSISNSKFDDAEYVIFGVPYDATQSFKPGSRFAPSAIREASWNLETYSTYFDFDLDLAKVCDAGNVNCDGNFEDIIRNMELFMASLTTQFPIALGGEHTISFAVTRNLKDCCYVVFDAHFDLRDEFDGTKFNHACTTRRILEDGKEVVILGVRSGIKDEVEFASRKVKWLYSWEYDVKEALKLVKDFDRIYLSLDMDVFDPSFAPGVSTPEPFGIAPIDFMRFVGSIADRLVGFDVVEVVPDSNRVTQMLAAKLVLEVIAARERNK